LKVSRPSDHFSGVRAQALPRLPALPEPRESDDPLDFTALYHRWFDDVARWIRALGGLDADLDDLAQEVFLVVRRKLPGFDGRKLPSWLYRITARTVSDYRRRAWFRHLVRGRRELPEGVAAAGLGPAELLERKEEWRTLARLLKRMSEKRRVAFVLFEIEGYSGEEIAAIVDVPVATVWTRLHHARADFRALVEDHARDQEGR
jgi:RNA polymerase sigma-70 factor (ECF subfamily)